MDIVIFCYSFTSFFKLKNLCLIRDQRFLKLEARVGIEPTQKEARKGVVADGSSYEGRVGAGRVPCCTLLHWFFQSAVLRLIPFGADFGGGLLRRQRALLVEIPRSLRTLRALRVGTASLKHL